MNASKNQVQPTRIQFFKEITGEILGFMIDEDYEPGMPHKLGFSLRQGYHAIPEGYIKTTRPASQFEYRDTVNELKNRGYILNILEHEAI